MGAKHKVTAGTLKQVQLWSAAGLTQESIASMLDIAPNTFRKYYNKAYDGGVDKMVSDLFEVEYGVAMDKERQESQKARQFLLKTRGKYSEKQEIEHSGGIDLKGFTIDFIDPSTQAED